MVSCLLGGIGNALDRALLSGNLSIRIRYLDRHCSGSSSFCNAHTVFSKKKIYDPVGVNLQQLLYDVSLILSPLEDSHAPYASGYEDRLQVLR